MQEQYVSNENCLRASIRHNVSQIQIGRIQPDGASCSSELLDKRRHGPIPCIKVQSDSFGQMASVKNKDFEYRSPPCKRRRFDVVGTCFMSSLEMRSSFSAMNLWVSFSSRKKAVNFVQAVTAILSRLATCP